MENIVRITMHDKVLNSSSEIETDTNAVIELGKKVCKTIKNGIWEIGEDLENENMKDFYVMFSKKGDLTTFSLHAKRLENILKPIAMGEFISREGIIKVYKGSSGQLNEQYKSIKNFPCLSYIKTLYLFNYCVPKGNEREFILDFENVLNKIAIFLHFENINPTGQLENRDYNMKLYLYDKRHQTIMEDTIELEDIIATYNLSKYINYNKLILTDFYKSSKLEGLKLEIFNQGPGTLSVAEIKYNDTLLFFCEMFLTKEILDFVRKQISNPYLYEKINEFPCMSVGFVPSEEMDKFVSDRSFNYMDIFDALIRLVGYYLILETEIYNYNNATIN